MTNVKQLTVAEITITGRANCNCPLPRKGSAPCEHDLKKLENMRACFVRSYEYFPGIAPPETLEAAADRITYDDALRQVKHNTAFRQRMPHIAERVRRMRAQLANLRAKEERAQ